MSDEPFFPKPEGPAPHLIIPRNAPAEGGDAPAPKQIEPAGADGFATETSFSVETTDNTSAVFPGDQDLTIIADGGMFGPPNWITQPVHHVPHWASYLSAVGLSNIGNNVAAFISWSKFKAVERRRVNGWHQIVQVPAIINANGQWDFGLYNADGTSLYGHSGYKHLVNDLGWAANDLFYLGDMALGFAVTLVPGREYIFAQLYKEGEANGTWREVMSQPYTNFQQATVRKRGGNVADSSDCIRYGWSGGGFCGTPAGLTPSLHTLIGTGGVGSCSLQEGPVGMLT